MFGDLFDDTAEGISPTVKCGGGASSSGGGGTSLTPITAPRSSCGLAGINNRGATCYMNALLQTLLFTPEFRESLFALGSSELGELVKKDLPEAKVRVIPIQLQRLFGRLLLLDQQSASTKELTDSFGWQNNEQFQQHDVQELNRILFSAIEDSLIGTSGQELISHLYHGIIVNKITCEECGRVSEREEDFLDLTLAVAHYSGVLDTLNTCYVDVERMEGQNQYHCSSCCKLVNAIKSAKIRSLPPILTVSLLRFSFDYQKCQRYKEIGKYIFPQEIDMTDYCEKKETSKTTVYELYSVLIHSGSTHGGHYHAYIKDIDGLGNWTTPEKEVTVLHSKPSKDRKVDLIELNSPLELLATMLRKRGGVQQKMHLDKLCQALSEETGVSWSKRFKKKYGTATKFVKSHQEVFLFDPQTNSVSMKQHSQEFPVAMSTDESHQNEDNSAMRGSSCSEESTAGPGASNRLNIEGFKESQNVENGARLNPDEVEGGDGDSTKCWTVDRHGDNKRIPTLGDHVDKAVIQGPRTDHLPCHGEIGQGEVLEQSGKDANPNPNRVCETDADPDCQQLTDPKTSQTSCHETLQQTTSENSILGSKAQLDTKTQTVFKKGEDIDKSEDHVEVEIKKHWFDFNDSKVTSINESFDLPRQFSGRESAYMLFYRRKSMERTKKAAANIQQGMPEWLLNEVLDANKQLNKQREEYDKAINSVQISVVYSDLYEYRSCALHKKPTIDVSPFRLSIDRRRSVADLKTLIMKELGESILNGLTVQNVCLHSAKQLPAGLHLYNCLSEDNSAILKDIGLTDDTLIFLWDGKKVDGMEIRSGELCEPILINLTYAVTRDNQETAEVQKGFAKDLTIGEMRALTSVETEIPPMFLTISRVVSSAVLIREEEDGKTVEEMGMKDGDRIIAEYKRRGKASSLAANEAMRQSRLVLVTVENRCSVTPEGTELPLIQVEIDKDVTVAELKTCVCSQLKDTNNQIITSECRLRVNAYSAGLQPPLHESLKIVEFGIKSGTELVIERGEPPRTNQITIGFSVCGGGIQQNPTELMVDKKSTVQETLEMVVGMSGVTGDQWHLRKTNWCGEPTEFLQDTSSTLDQENILNGALLLLEEGRLPPKGFIRLPIWIYPSPDKGQDSTSNAQKELLSWMNTQIMNLILSNESQKDNTVGKSQHALVGNVELSQDATLNDFKVQILTLPGMSEVGLPGPDFLRIRLMDRGHLGRVLRENHQTLRKLKIASASQIAVQILQEEENLSVSAIVLNICRRIPETRTYLNAEELIWDTSKAASPESLRQVIADHFLLPVEHTAIAKHLIQKFEWLVIQQSVTEKKSGKGRNKKKGKGGAKALMANLKQAPYHIKDGDTLGVKDLRFDSLNKDDFTTEEDDDGKKALEKEVEEKRKRRQEQKENDTSSEAGVQKQHQKKPEVGLTIRVANFR
ncbi:ubiquitin carboxyl-terminal hydrolase 40-like isoform X1 [Asterias amurensis]|uniref:ubiquitin carboxyl-terminal hydrolase 40-like isoform X1 n=1 Tax=Asterias amurensis TaxID=7602 RepID=UPI003AB62934